MSRQDIIIYKKKKASEVRFNFSLPSFERDFKREQWLVSRFALLMALKEYGIEVKNSDELEIDRFLSLQYYPNLLVSLSHHKDWGAAIICQSSSILSVGVDIEDVKRVLKEGTKKFFVHSKDSSMPLIKLWIAKEAAFKAISPLWENEKVLVLSDIWVTNESFGIAEERLGTLTFFDESQAIIGAYALLEKICQN